MYRIANGSSAHVCWDLEKLAQISEIKYKYQNFEEANNDNNKIIQGDDNLFLLNEEHFNLINQNSLYPAYYLINYGSGEIYSDSVDAIKFLSEHLFVSDRSQR